MGPGIMTEPEKITLTSLDISEEKRERLKQLFPEILNDDQIDFDQLKRVLGEWVKPGKERFGLSWPGKAECMRIIQQPSVATLKPARDESVNFDDTENLFIEGDNLEVLKLLQKSYFGKVKMIYIDPPYNTGKEFIYPDKYNETLDTYLEYTGQKDSAGRKFSTNTDAAGRYHSRWLNMMYPRLYLAKNLMRDDGVIFISIDDVEVGNLRQIANEVFGEENFINQFVWETKKGAQGMATQNMIVTNHEYILAYARLKENFKYLGLTRDQEDFSNPDNDPRGAWKRQYLQRLGQGLPTRSIRDPSSKRKYTFETPYTQEKLDQWVVENRIIFPAGGNSYPARKEFLNEYKNNQQLITGLGLYPTKSTTEKLHTLFNNLKIFPNPKPYTLLHFLAQAVMKDNDIVLDFFAGSGTTAHAVMQLNQEDSGNRKFICVQLPEFINEKSEAHKAGYKTIADIGKERIRRVAKKIETEQHGQLDLGFKVFKLARSNFKVWEGEVEKIADLEKQLFDHIDHLNQASSPEDILYELLLKAGFTLTTRFEKITMAGKDVFSIEEGTLLICLDKDLTQEVIDALAKETPRQVICLDAGFKGNDQLKTNAVQTFKARAQEAGSEIVFKTI